MNILHYTLGLLPYRSGGLTKYSSDLMTAQSSKKEDHVSLLYPGDFSLFTRKRHIIKNKPYGKVDVYEIKNSSIVPLLYGIRFPTSIIQDKNILSTEKLQEFYNQIQPDIFHIHTLMGLPYELLVFLKEKSVKIVFSTHDYFGLCPKVNFIDYLGNVCNEPSPYKCARCNSDAPNNVFLRIRNFKCLSRLKKHVSRQPLPTPQKNQPVSCDNSFKATEYEELTKYYANIYALIDMFHFNSSVSQQIYTSFISRISRSVILPISHATLVDKRAEKHFNPSLIRFGFIGNLSVYKGFPIIKNVLMKLKKEKFDNWKLYAWGSQNGIDKDCNRILYSGKYTSNQLSDIFSDMDLLIVPSLCYETFGLVVLEALSHGVPVLVSSTVGAKDIVKKYAPNFIFDTPDSLVDKLREVLNTPRILEDYNKVIINKKEDFSFDKHVNKISMLYRTL